MLQRLYTRGKTWLYRCFINIFFYFHPRFIIDHSEIELFLQLYTLLLNQSNQIIH